jgi:LmbE family N-acetylglucosaminyl deacetylase
VLRLQLSYPTDRPFRLLCLGAHPDDIEIGAAATIARIRDEAPSLSSHWVVLSGTPERAAEARASARALVGPSADLTITQEAFRDGNLPFLGPSVKDALASVRDGFDPDLVIAPRVDDLHQDHALLGGLAYQLFRDHLVLAYEIAKTDGDLATPDVYVALDVGEVEAKVAHLHRHFPSQAGRPWFETEAFRAVLRLRGLEANAPSGFAEAFHVRRIVL